MALAATCLVALALLLRRLGLERADQLSSVLAMFFALFALAAAAAALRQGHTPPASGRVDPPSSVRWQRTAWGQRRLPGEVRALLSATEAAADIQSNPLLGERRRVVSAVYVRQRIEQPGQDTAGRQGGRPPQTQRLSGCGRPVSAV
ncbi:hypothetical protein GCM10022251_77350 [Phytohabitans flavus]|uniref:Uncharacterized protein n=1 Tax=Phytohabitans flavus TaxID=1076124 RepID=A0A6F8XIN0_9ACTN|nr:hypothetical protein Pflav_000860 [Phytohabitans flavus]